MTGRIWKIRGDSGCVADGRWLGPGVGGENYRLWRNGSVLQAGEKREETMKFLAVGTDQW